MDDRERLPPGPKPRPNVKRFQIHYRVNHDMRILLTQLRKPLKCKSDQDVIDHCITFTAQRFQPPVYRTRWMGKRK